MLIISISQNEVNNQTISASDASGVLQLYYNHPDNELYTAIMIDLDAPYPNNNYNSPYLHLLKINIRGRRFNEGTYLIPYLEPQPPEDSSPHRYQVILYAQESYTYFLPVHQRAQFNLEEFVNQYNLTEVDSAEFYAVED